MLRCRDTKIPETMNHFEIHIIDKNEPNGFLYNFNNIDFCEMFDDAERLDR